MDTKHIHCMLEDMAEYGKKVIEAGAGSGNVNLEEAKTVVEMVEKLAKAEYHALIAKAMRKSEEEDEAEEKYIRKKIKEEYADEYKRMREEYGEDEGERRFYDNYRWPNGRFAPKGRGSYEPRRGGRRGRRGYEEMMPMDYQMDIEDYKTHPAEYMRDLDRMVGRMYYSDGGSSGGSSGGSGGSSVQSGSSGGSGGGSGGSSGGNSGGGSSRGYEEYQRGYSEGNAEGRNRGYSEGYRDGESNGRNQGSNSRYDRARRGYEEKKEMNKGNSPQENSENMKGLEELLNVVGGDVKELSPKMSPSEKAMTAQKFDTWSKMLKQ